MNTLDVVSEIIAKNSEIDFLTFFKYPEQTLIQTELDLSPKEQTFVDLALETRNKYRLPFWDALMLSFFDKKDVPTKLLSRALAHTPNFEKIKTRDADEMRKLVNEFPMQNFSLNSEVTFSNSSVKHLYLLDFHIYHSENNLTIITEVLGILQLHGYILNSGESYHFISDSFFDLDDLLDLLAKSLLFAPIIDRAWIAHQLLERSCSLRIGMKHDTMPIVIKKV